MKKWLKKLVRIQTYLDLAIKIIRLLSGKAQDRSPDDPNR